MNLSCHQCDFLRSPIIPSFLGPRIFNKIILRQINAFLATVYMYLHSILSPVSVYKMCLLLWYTIKCDGYQTAQCRISEGYNLYTHCCAVYIPGPCLSSTEFPLGECSTVCLTAQFAIQQYHAVLTWARLLYVWLHQSVDPHTTQCYLPASHPHNVIYIHWNTCCNCAHVLVQKLHIQ